MVVAIGGSGNRNRLAAKHERLAKSFHARQLVAACQRRLGNVVSRRECRLAGPLNSPQSDASQVFTSRDELVYSLTSSSCQQ